MRSGYRPGTSVTPPYPWPFPSAASCWRTSRTRSGRSARATSSSWPVTRPAWLWPGTVRGGFGRPGLRALSEAWEAVLAADAASEEAAAALMGTTSPRGNATWWPGLISIAATG